VTIEPLPGGHGRAGLFQTMAARHTMIIKASITAYSTAVGPSSEVRERRTLLAKRIMVKNFF
jgi:hypothetical protein